MTIAILEDNAERRAAMERLLAMHFPGHSRQYFTSSSAMVEWLRANLNGVIFISLDHDLELLPGDNGQMVDCGTGREVADFLATQPARCPVVIHSTNYPAAAGMEMVLADSGWSVERISPYGDLEWIEEAWFPAVRNQIVESAIAPRSSK
jgi:FixJ family two-component response regulator